MANWSSDRQQAVQARCDRATRVPWRYVESDNVMVAESEAADAKPFTPIGIIYPQFTSTEVGIAQRIANAEFTAVARTDLPDALAAITAKDAEIARLNSLVLTLGRLRLEDAGSSLDVQNRQQADLTRLAEVGKPACASCQYWDGRGKPAGRHRCFANDGVSELLFVEDEALWTDGKFGCVLHSLLKDAKEAARE